MLPGEEVEAKRRHENASADWRRIADMKAEMATILGYACSQACAHRGVHLTEKQVEEVQLMIERWL